MNKLSKEQRKAFRSVIKDNLEQCSNMKDEVKELLAALFPKGAEVNISTIDGKILKGVVHNHSGDGNLLITLERTSTGSGRGWAYPYTQVTLLDEEPK